MIRLFISYTQSATGEYALARALETRLRERGVEVFRDETSIHPGQEWKEVLRQRLSAWATHVLFIVSEGALSREWVQYEIQLAHDRLASRNGLQVLWLPFNRDSGLPDTHWLHEIQNVRVPGKQPPHVRESEWVAAVESSLGLQPGSPGLSNTFAEYIEEKTSGFVGREHVFAEIRKFFRQEKSGYLTLIGEPGLGKTAILCELTKRECCVAHFFIRTVGIARVEQMYESIGRQLHDRYGVGGPPAGEPWGITFTAWLKEAREKLAPGDKLIIVIDALDECEDLQASEGAGNMLSLPRKLPDDVYCVLSRRELDPNCFNLRLETEPGVGNEELELMKWADDNRRDIETFLRAQFESRPDHPWLQRHQQTAEQAISLFTEKSDGNFMYLRYVLPQIEKEPDAFTPRKLPKGLKAYYLGHWKRMTDPRRGVKRPGPVFEVIYLMVVSKSPLTARQIATMLSISVEQVSPLIQQWREFLETDPIGGQPGYRIYHWHFAEFLQEQDPVADAAVGVGPKFVGPRRTRASQTIKNYLLGILGRAGR